MIRHHVRMVSCLALLLGCTQATGPEATSAPGVGKADSTDRADRECRVVLRTAAVEGYEPENYVDDWQAFAGVIGVREELAHEGWVGLMYSVNGGDWREVEAEPIGEPTGGQQDYAFRIWEDIWRVGSPTSTWGRLRLAIIPVVHLADGGRLFDHNRVAGPFDTYVLSAYDNGFRIDDDPAVCAPVETRDIADRECGVVLREVGIEGDEAESHVDGWQVWSGHVDVREDLALGANVGVRYSANGGEWQEVTAHPTGEVEGGHARFEFRLWEGIWREGTPNESWDYIRVELMPVLYLPDGTRLFDHNRVEEDLENYVLAPWLNDLAITDDGATCR